MLLPRSINIYKYSYIYIYKHSYGQASPLVSGINHRAVLEESCSPTTREHCHPDIPLQSVPPPTSPSVMPGLWTASPPLPSCCPNPLLGRGGAVLAAVWFSDRYQSCCLSAENKTHFWTMGNSVSSAALCSLLWRLGGGKGLNIAVRDGGGTSYSYSALRCWGAGKAPSFLRPTGKAPGVS